MDKLKNCTNMAHLQDLVHAIQVGFFTYGHDTIKLINQHIEFFGCDYNNVAIESFELTGNSDGFMCKLTLDGEFNYAFSEKTVAASVEQPLKSLVLRG